MSRLLALAATAALAAAAVPADKVASIPGFGTPLSDMYSGYVQGGANKMAHYVYTASLNAPTTDPVVAWFNGGPGCSSMEGFLSESGLYHVQEYSSPVTLYQNPFSWTNFTNSLYIESPAAVGFSYCTVESACQHTDTSTAQDNLNALVSFFAAYPELKKNDFWLAGESYAGIYVPSLAYAVYQYNQKNPSSAINLKGILVGNGCIGYNAGHCGNDDINDYHDIQIWRGHGLVSETLYDTIMKICVWGNESPACQNALQEAANGIGDIDVYYLYNTCDDPAALNRPRAPYKKGGMLDRVRKAREARRADKEASGEGLSLDPNCYGTGPTLETWFNQADVKAAFHVATAIDWSLCSNNASFGYNPDIPDERTEIYPTLTQKAGYQVLVYNGEADLCVPYTDNEWWTRSMNYSTVRAWQAWMVSGEEGPYVGGYAIKYNYNFTFATVRGAGHMVPETRPEAALTLLKNHIFGTGEW